MPVATHLRMSCYITDSLIRYSHSTPTTDYDADYNIIQLRSETVIFNNYINPAICFVIIPLVNKNALC